MINTAFRVILFIGLIFNFAGCTSSKGDLIEASQKGDFKGDSLKY